MTFISGLSRAIEKWTRHVRQMIKRKLPIKRGLARGGGRGEAEPSTRAPNRLVSKRRRRLSCQGRHPQTSPLWRAFVRAEASRSSTAKKRSKNGRKSSTEDTQPTPRTLLDAHARDFRELAVLKVYFINYDGENEYIMRSWVSRCFRETRLGTSIRASFSRFLFRASDLNDTSAVRHRILSTFISITLLHLPFVELCKDLMMIERSKTRWINLLTQDAYIPFTSFTSLPIMGPTMDFSNVINYALYVT